MILYRPVGLQELELIYDSGMRAFPARLPQQPIFYPVLQLEYAQQTASDWNAKSGQSAGYVTQFKVEDEYISQFEEHTVGGSQYQEFWIPAEDVEEFNRHIVGHIKVVAAFFGDGFQGFIPDQFGLQGKDAVAQFTLLANSYLYKRMEFYLEIKRNHKAIFLNYLFWQKYEFKNQGLKAKVLQTIKEAWLTSFPKIPLPMPLPIHEDPPSVEQTDAQAHSTVNPIREDPPFSKQTTSQPLVNAEDDDPTPVKPIDVHAHTPRPANPVDDDPTPVKPLDIHPPVPRLVKPVHEERSLVKQTDAQARAQHLLNRFHQDRIIPTQTDVHAHFSRGIELGLSGKFHEAIDELSKAVEDDPRHVAARTSLGVVFHRLGEDDRALSCYEAALRIDPNDAEAYYFRANILYSRGNVREAIAGYTIAIGLKPELVEAHQKSNPQDRLTDYSPGPAEMYKIAKPAQRILALNKLLESNPQQANLFNERAAEYYRLWNYERAVADYSSSLALQPDDASVLHLRGVAYEQLRQFDHAREDYQRAVAIDPQLPNVYINRGVTFGSSGQFRQSIASLTEAIRLAPDNPDGYFNRGTSHFQIDDLERAIEDFSIVIQLSPGDQAAYYWRGISNERAGRRDAAIADYRQFLELSQEPKARQEIEQKLRQWNAGKPDSVRSRNAVPEDRQKTNQIPAAPPDPEIDLYGLIVALGEQALHSTWFGSGVECYGEKAEELYDLTDQNKPIEGRRFLHLASGIRQTIQGDFQAFEPGGTSPWLFIRAWDGSGFYIETNDPTSKELLKTHFQSMEEVEGASPPYEALFLRI